MLAVLQTVGLCLLNAKSTAQMQEHYKKVAEGLIGVRKEYPISQPRVYGMLDQLDKLYSTAKQVAQKKQTFKKKIQEKTAENTALKQDIATLRNDVSSIRKVVENAKSELAQKLAEEKAKAEQSSREHKELLDKVAIFEAERKEQEQKVAHKQVKKSTSAEIST